MASFQLLLLFLLLFPLLPLLLLFSLFSSLLLLVWVDIIQPNIFHPMNAIINSSRICGLWTSITGSCWLTIFRPYLWVRTDHSGYISWNMSANGQSYTYKLVELCCIAKYSDINSEIRVCSCMSRIVVGSWVINHFYRCCLHVLKLAACGSLWSNYNVSISVIFIYWLTRVDCSWRES